MICVSASGIRWPISIAFLALVPLAAVGETGAVAAGWQRILNSVGLDLAVGPAPFTILEGDSPPARAFGFRSTAETVLVAAVEELRDPQLEVVWERPLTLPVYKLPLGARVFAREKWGKSPLVAGWRQDGRAVLWTATGVGEKGYERFPYLLQALADLGVEFPFRGARTWAFFDSSYRLRADSDFLARRWRAAGIAAIHAAAWHYYDPDPGRDEYLKKLIEACHRQGILVYAWLELPHVSEKFWDDHPGWREKTAILQDAHLDWRKLMNLADPDCSRAVGAGLRALVARFDWDGVNLAELYFESLSGPADPQRFTPMSDTVRSDFRQEAGFDPWELFRRDSPRYWERDRGAWSRFAAFRAALALRLEERWLAAAKSWRPDLDLVLTHIDDRFDTRMKEHLGADAAAALPLLDRFNFTFAVEDPATVWHLGPERYAEMARRYAELTPHQDRLAVDINTVERYQDVYPTKRQTGSELFQLVHAASRAFSRVMLYFEQSIARTDYDLLAAASATVSRVKPAPGGLQVEASQTVGVRRAGPVRLDGRPWPATDGEIVWIPAGRHLIESDPARLPLHLLQLNADLLDARVIAGGIEINYRSSGRAPALLDYKPNLIEMDGRKIDPQVLDAGAHFTILLPPGQRTVRVLAQ
ncbi:MAG: hypothetical protein HY236_04940 [Acidobacteria bacterium]|nr:hypothetical protein [Acidobacteriota bacterium]